MRMCAAMQACVVVIGSIIIIIITIIIIIITITIITITITIIIIIIITIIMIVCRGVGAAADAAAWGSLHDDRGGVIIVSHFTRHL